MDNSRFSPEAQCAIGDVMGQIDRIVSANGRITCFLVKSNHRDWSTLRSAISRQEKFYADVFAAPSDVGIKTDGTIELGSITDDTDLSFYLNVIPLNK